MLTIVLQDGVIIGANNRAIEEEIVCDKNCEKIHYFPPNIYYKCKQKYIVHQHQATSNSSFNNYHSK